MIKQPSNNSTPKRNLKADMGSFKMNIKAKEFTPSKFKLPV